MLAIIGRTTYSLAPTTNVDIDNSWRMVNITLNGVKTTCMCNRSILTEYIKMDGSYYATTMIRGVITIGNIDYNFDKSNENITPGRRTSMEGLTHDECMHYMKYKDQVYYLERATVFKTPFTFALFIYAILATFVPTLISGTVFSDAPTMLLFAIYICLAAGFAATRENYHRSSNPYVPIRTLRR